MKTIGVVCHSEKGRTKVVAEEIASGVNATENSRAVVISVTDTIDWEILSGLDAMIFGCPTYMGSVSAQFKTFMDASSATWMRQGWKNKLAAGFTNSHAYSGDKLNVLIQLAVFAAQHGMLWVGQGEMQAGPDVADVNRLGSFLGLMTQSDVKLDAMMPPTGDRRTAYLFGRRIAAAAHALNPLQ